MLELGISLVYAAMLAFQMNEKTFEEKLRGDLGCVGSCWQSTSLGIYLSIYLIHPF